MDNNYFTVKDCDILNKRFPMTSQIEMAIKEANTALPSRKIADLIERTNLSADMKSLLNDIAQVTVKVGGKLVTIGRKILSVAFELVKLFPTITFGAIAALVISALIAKIAIIGSVVSAFLSPLLLLIGVGKGALMDLSNPKLDEKISTFIDSIAALKEV